MRVFHLPPLSGQSLGVQLNAEDVAMLQALYSRSPASVESHLRKVQAATSGAFMEKYYINYGHDSIAECGGTTFFLEGVSLFAALLLQDHSLYRGQEASTRYIDFSKDAENPQPLCDPLLETNASEETKEARKIAEGWRDLYCQALGILNRSYLQRGFKQKEALSFACDVARGWLPLGMSTSLSWTTDLRQVNLQSERLFHLGFEEAITLAEKMTSSAKEAFPSSIKPLPSVPLGRSYAAFPASFHEAYNKKRSRVFNSSHLIELQNRQSHEPLSPDFAFYGDLTARLSSIDLGAFRELHRHRRMFCPIPPLLPATAYHQEPTFYNKTAFPPELHAFYSSHLIEASRSCEQETKEQVNSILHETNLLLLRGFLLFRRLLEAQRLSFKIDFGFSLQDEDPSLLDRFLAPPSLGTFLQRFLPTDEGGRLTTSQLTLLGKLRCKEIEAACIYSLPLGMALPSVALQLNLIQAYYLIELRSSTTVHPILQVGMRELLQEVQSYFPTLQDVESDERRKILPCKGLPPLPMKPLGDTLRYPYLFSPNSKRASQTIVSLENDLSSIQKS